LLGLLFNSENKGGIFLRNVGGLGSVMYQKICLSGCWQWYITFGITEWRDSVLRVVFWTKHSVSETGSVSIVRWKGGEAAVRLERAHVGHHCTWGRKQIRFSKYCVILE
jgi:hypothetical protein